MESVTLPTFDNRPCCDKCSFVLTSQAAQTPGSVTDLSGQELRTYTKLIRFYTCSNYGCPRNQASDRFFLPDAQPAVVKNAVGN